MYLSNQLSNKHFFSIYESFNFKNNIFISWIKIRGVKTRDVFSIFLKQEGYDQFHFDYHHLYWDEKLLI